MLHWLMLSSSITWHKKDHMRAPHARIWDGHDNESYLGYHKPISCFWWQSWLSLDDCRQRWLEDMGVSYDITYHGIENGALVTSRIGNSSLIQAAPKTGTDDQGIHQTKRCLTLKFGKQRLTMIGSDIRCHEDFANIQLMIPKPGCRYTQRHPWRCWTDGR